MKFVTFTIISVCFVLNVASGKLNNVEEKLKLSTFNVLSKVNSSTLFPSINSHSKSYSQKEKTWLLTQEWIIDNINRLNHQLNELARDYNQHVERTKEEKSLKEAEFVRDITTLRADHSVIEQHQQQILNYIKHNRMKNQLSELLTREHMNNFHQTSFLNNLKKKRHSILKFIKSEKEFEKHTKNNVTQIFDQLTSLKNLFELNSQPLKI